MAAYSALLSLKFTINQIQQHPRPPISLDQQQLLSLTQILDFLQNFLEAFSKELDDDELESQIADAAYAAEDAIESHIVDQIKAGSTCDAQNIRCLHFYQGVDRVIQDMDSIKKKVMEVIEVKKMGAQPHLLMVDRDSSSISDGRYKMQNKKMVGFGDILVAVMDKLTRHDSNLEIIPIVGMAGMGKTTLARNIYAHPLIVHHFDILVWVTISQDYSVPKFLSQVLSEEDKGCRVHELGERVYKKLWGRRYLIVMDDIWHIEVWDEAKCFFPDNINGSRIMITTRLSNLAFQMSGSHEFVMRFLDEHTSWDLLCEIVFDKGEGCPAELEIIGKEIVRKCRGLPLSIVVIGGVLSQSNNTREYWEYTLENLHSLINLDDNERCLQILGISYRELAIHLKPCFLYMGIFPEDHVIHVSDLIKLLVAEGFLKPIENKSLEEVAFEYVTELIDRNLILVHELRWNGKVKSCKIHDLVRDVCLREGKKQRFICVLRQQDLNIPQDINMERRISIHDIDDFFESSPHIIHVVESPPLTRSLIVFGSGFYRAPPSSTCRLLRVFVCFRYYECFFKSYDDIEALFQHVNLRCLFVGIEKLPTSWCLLWNLQTLVANMRLNSAMAPSEFWKMTHHRHVFFNYLELPNAYDGVDDFVLKNLHRLSCIQNFKCTEDVVKKVPNLKRLGLRYTTKSLRKSCLNNLGCLRYLTSLFLHTHYGLKKYIQNLNFPHSLKKLSLSHTRLLWEDLNTVIGSLPLLEVLRLLKHSCVGTEWETIEGQFRSLKFLSIAEHDLKCWTTDNTHFPLLECLILRDVSKLEEIPSSIGDIPTLRLIDLICCPASVIASAERIKEEQLSYGNEDFQLAHRYYY